MRYRVGLAVGLLIALWALVSAACGDEPLAPTRADVRPLWSVSAGGLTVSATCGTLGPLARLNDSQYTVRYTAPSSGPCMVIPVDSLGADTAAVQVAAATATQGLPFGPYRCMTNGCPAPFTLSADFNSPSTIVQQIADARSKDVTIMLAMTGGAHRADDWGCCLDIINGVLQFSLARWRTKMAEFNTATIRNAIAAGVADGTILGATVMDEPMTHGGGDGNTWGPVGTMTKARVDGLCGEVKAMFPALPAGVEHQHQLFEPTKSYAVCDFLVDQYNSAMGDVTTWRNAGLAMAQRDHHAIAFSMNVLNGGTQDKDGTWDCGGTGGLGLYSPNCRLLASQVKSFGLTLGPFGCGLFMWRWDGDFMSRTDNKASFAAVASALATITRKPCRRTA